MLGVVQKCECFVQRQTSSLKSLFFNLLASLVSSFHELHDATLEEFTDKLRNATSVDAGAVTGK